MAKVNLNISALLPENNRSERIWKLAQVDFKKRYYNDKFGLVWALINPLSRVLIYWLVFTYLFEKAIEGIENYALFLFAGIITWMFFREICQKSLTILYKKRYLIENIQVNKIDIFLSNGISVLIGFLFNLAAFILISLIMGVSYSLKLLLLPILISNVFIIALGIGMILSSLYIFFKDIIHIMDIVFLFGFWSSGIFFRGKIFLDVFPAFLYLNPFVGIIINMRNILIYDSNLDYQLLLINLISGLIIFFIGTLLMNKYSKFAYENI